MTQISNLGSRESGKQGADVRMSGQISINENLRSAGFEQIGSSQLYKKNNFIIDVQKPIPTLYTALGVGTGYEVHGILGSDEMGKPALTIVSKHEGRFHLASFGKEGGFVSRSSEVGWAKACLTGLSVPDQLKEAGFIADNQHSEIFRLKTRLVGRKDCEVIAIIANGKIAAVAQPVSSIVQDKIDADTRVVVGDGSQIAGDKEQELITLRNDTIEFQVGDSGSIIEGTQRLLKEVAPEFLKISSVEEITDASGFVVGGMNLTDAIRGLRELQGRKISSLEVHMRDRKFSSAGFLADGESLIDVLANDNDYVTGLGLSHQELANHLKYAMAISNLKFGSEFEYRGSLFRVECTQFCGFQMSPFRDDTIASSDYSLVNLSNGKRLFFSELVPQMAERYGFYEGSVSHRVEPKDIVELFGLSNVTDSKSSGMGANDESGGLVMPTPDIKQA
jgi:hypothetical protein